MNTFEIEIDSYTFYVSVTDYFPGYAAKTHGPPEDCYEGCPEEIEWICTAIEDCDEDGNTSVLSAEEVKVVISKYSDLIEETLLEEIRDMRDDDFDYDDDGYDGY